MRGQNKAFTLVELIVVITILAILGTIAFISLQGYSASSRDSVRLSDINNMKKTLELYALDKSKYPTPDLLDYDITYSGGLVWTQGTFSENVLKEIQKLSNIPLDPLTKNPYTYSVLNTKKEYEIGAVFEEGLSKNILDKSYAEGTKIGTAYVTGTYNGKVAKVETGSKLYVLAVPTIINADISDLDYVSIAANNTLVYNGGSNLPSTYTGSVYTLTGSTSDPIVNNVLVFEGTSMSELTDSNQTVNRTNFLIALQDAYSGTVIENDEDIKYILSASTASDAAAATIVNNTLGGTISVSTELPVCTFTDNESSTDPANQIGNCQFG